MTGRAIASEAIAAATLRALACEYGGPRPAGTRDADPVPARTATARATRP